jgi:hypothetical protein
LTCIEVSSRLDEGLKIRLRRIEMHAHLLLSIMPRLQAESNRE